MFRTCDLQIMLIITSLASAFWITLILSFNFQKPLCLKFKQVFDLSCLMISDHQCSPNLLFLFFQQSLKQSDSKKTLSRWWRQRGRYAHRYWKNRGRLPLWTLIHTLSLRYSKSSMNLIQEVIQFKKKNEERKQFCSWDDLWSHIMILSVSSRLVRCSQLHMKVEKGHKRNFLT